MVHADGITQSNELISEKLNKKSLPAIKMLTVPIQGGVYSKYTLMSQYIGFVCMA